MSEKDYKSTSVAKLVEIALKRHRQTTWGTGLPSLDKLLAPTLLAEQPLVVVAGRPGTGSQVLLSAITLEALKSERSVFVHVTRGSAEEFVEGLACWLADIPQKALIQRSLSPAEANRYVDGLRWLAKRSMHVSSGVVTVEQVRRDALRHHSSGLDLVVIDGIHALKQSTPPADHINHVCLSAVHLASEVKCPLVVRCKADRQVDSREDKRPRLADIPEILEEAASVVLLTSRVDNDAIEVSLAKHRSGTTDRVPLYLNRIEEPAN